MSYGLIYKNKSGLNAVVIQGKKGTHVSTEMIERAFSVAKADGVTKYVGEFHNHPTAKGGSWQASPGDVEGAFDIAAQLNWSYRAFFSAPNGVVYEWNTKTSDHREANRNLISHGRWNDK